MSAKRDHHNSLIEKRNTLVAKRDGLKAASAAALVAGQDVSKVSTAEITDLSHQIEAMDAAIATVGDQADREETAARAESAALRLQQQAEDLQKSRSDFITLIGKTEAQARALINMLSEIDRTAGTLDDICYEITRRHCSIGLPLYSDLSM